MTRDHIFAVRCGNCSADVPVETVGDYTRCPFCEAALYVGAADGVRHLAAVATIGTGEVAATLARRLDEREMEGRVSVERSTLVYVPVYRIERSGDARPTLVTAAGVDVPDLEDLLDLDRQLEPYDSSIAERGEVIEPEMPVEDVLEAFLDGPAGDGEAPRLSLVHAPIHRVRYRLGDRGYDVAIDAVSGKASAQRWPPTSQGRKDRVLGAIAAGSFVAFAVETLAVPSLWCALLAYAGTALLAYSIAVLALSGLEKERSP